MVDMLKDVTFEDCNGGKRKQFVVRCMKRGTAYRSGLFGVLDVLTNTFVLLPTGCSREAAKATLYTGPVNLYNRWVEMVSDGLKNVANQNS